VSGRVALVTGAGRGIGRATAIALAARGDEVMAVARTEADLRSLAATTPVSFLVESVATSDGCARIVDETRTRLGPVDILVNNAGVDLGESPIWDQDPAVWREIMAVNVDAPFELTRLLVGDMIERTWGRIVMVGSTAGNVGGPSMAGYCSSKHAVLGLMRSVAQDVAPFSVTCNAVAPGWVRTSMADRSATREAAERGISEDDVWAERAAGYRAGRVVEPEEVAAVIAFLSSEAASAVNGETVTVALGEIW
jgi:NAD(P)-dependent dehydrogenase (short-subunit alcohol dehydrogenase family)